MAFYVLYGISCYLYYFMYFSGEIEFISQKIAIFLQFLFLLSRKIEFPFKF